MAKANGKEIDWLEEMQALLDLAPPNQVSNSIHNLRAEILDKLQDKMAKEKASEDNK